MPKSLSVSSLCLFFIVLLLSLALANNTPAVAQGPTPQPRIEQPPSPALQTGIIPGEVLVKFKPQQLGALSLEEAVQVRGLALLEAAPNSGWLRIQVEPGREREVLAELRANGDVESANFNYPIYALNTPNDPRFGRQWALHNTGQTGGTVDSDIDAPDAWDIETGDNTVTIAVIDTGVDLDHPDLQANIVPGFDFYNNDPVADDDNGHGSHVAGIAAAVGNNGTGIAGVSWKAKIMPLKILSAFGIGSTLDLIEALHFAADNGANIVNLSLGGSCSFDWSNVQAALNYASNKGVLIVAASGNSGGTVLCPAALENVIAVGATDHQDQRWSGSNFGSALDVVAPGVAITSTLAGGTYGIKTGSSMSGPHVAGLAALIWSFKPTLTTNEVDNLIITTTDDLGGPGWDQFFGHGRINAWQALSKISLETPSELTLYIDDDLASVSGSIPMTAINPGNLSWTAEISPAVPWLTTQTPNSGIISAASSPTTVVMTATHPFTYGTYTTTLAVTASNGSNTAIPDETKITLIYVPELNRVFFPLIFSTQGVPDHTTHR
ncbi:MAG: S8 family peptidase [Anaerolineae bacterium]|nr:S8 family peptidase [Anaerolineae bacterium]